MAQKIMCNANSFGNIDYKKPVLFTQKDYRTSTSSAHKYIPIPLRVEYYNINTARRSLAQGCGSVLADISLGYTPQCSAVGIYDADILHGSISEKPRIGTYALQRDGRLGPETYKTTSGTAYIKRYAKPNANEVSKTAGRCTETNYMISVKEKMFKNPPMPVRSVISEYHASYVPKDPVDIYYTPPSVHCRLQSNGTDEQPRIILEAGGTYKLMDPYLSTTRMTHYPFTHDETKWASADNLGTLWKSMKNPYKGPVPKEPICDRTVFKRPIMSRLVPEIICQLPHFGKTSEYKSKYIPLTKHSMWDKIVIDDNWYPESLSGPNKIQTQCAPGMYCTEKCHLGVDWGPGRVVDPTKRFRKKVHKHCIPCYSDIVF